MKVAIVGTAPDSRMMAPFSEKEWEIWVCSAGNSQASALPRVTRWFEMHALVDMTGPENRAWSLPYFGWLRAQEFPIYLQEKSELIPQAIVYPFKKMIDLFGKTWFTSSVAWMMAFAIQQMRAGDEIALFGIDMAADQEHYTSQKAGCLRWIEIAKEKGIKVSIPYESCLGKQFPLYGYSEATPLGRKLNIRKHALTTQRAQIDAQIKHLELMRAFYDGSLEDVNYMIRTWTDGEDAELDVGEEDVSAAAKAYAEAHVPLAEAPKPEDFEQAPGTALLVPKRKRRSSNGAAMET